MIYRVVFDALWHFMEDDGWAMASHIALSTLLAVFPFIIFGTTMAAFLGADQFAPTVINIIFGSWPDLIKKPITDQVLQVLTIPRRGLLTASVLAAAYFASNGVEALRISLNRAYRVTEIRPWYVTRLASLGYVVLSSFACIIISFLLVAVPLALGHSQRFFPAFYKLLRIIWNGRIYGSLLIIFIGLVFAHLFLPAGKRKIVSVLPGVLFTVVSWLFGAVFFTYYISTFSTYTATYAGLASIMIVLVFLYMLGVIFIIGAELNASLIKYNNICTGLISKNS
ncbi:Ribonuclease BN [Liberibacter crescens BT-1]|uniref:Ribonuclease BN n=2 Tax=Liberibacter crescens TaxID=1273132 RepID=L0ETC6_LIBCB|nr:Ribonuclease BN [Liberibacter crescens BT-1]